MLDPPLPIRILYSIQPTLKSEGNATRCQAICIFFNCLALKEEVRPTYPQVTYVLCILVEMKKIHYKQICFLEYLYMDIYNM